VFWSAALLGQTVLGWRNQSYTGRVKVIGKINFRVGIQPHQIRDAYLRTIE
jgi:hypothetical protein